MGGGGGTTCAKVGVAHGHGMGAYGCMGLGGWGGMCYWFLCTGATAQDNTCSS